MPLWVTVDIRTQILSRCFSNCRFGTLAIDFLSLGLKKLSFFCQLKKKLMSNDFLNLGIDLGLGPKKKV